MRSPHRLGLALLIPLCCVALASSFSAQSPPERIPTPKEFFGYELGTHFTPHGQLVRYCEKLAALSPRVTLERYGETYQGRPLCLLTVTSPTHHDRIDEVRGRLSKLADPRLLSEADDVKELIVDLPCVVWLSYNVHGNESSPSEVALSVLYRLATAEDEETRAWLEGAILLIDPCVNPDGRDRYVNWFNDVVGRSPDPDPQALEHQEPWPGGRFNHYLFDLNRDWAFATQAETKARLPRFVAWAPQVHVDFHEMGPESTYFFFPAEKPVNANLPGNTMKWGKVFGRGNADAFDSRGWRYYTGEDFDLFYPGYGDTWPSFTGAIGMTYEQGGHGRAGLAYRRTDGSILTLADRVAHHTVASYATIDTAVKNRAGLLSDFHEFRRSAIEEGASGPIRAYLLPPGPDPARVQELAGLLSLQGIESHVAAESFSMRSVTDASGAKILDRTFEAGTLIVFLAQPLKRLATTLLEPRAQIRELYFYDVSAWSLPFAYGIPAFASEVRPTVRVVKDGALPAQGGVGEGDPKVGWLLRYDQRGALLALSDLLSLGVIVRSARKEFAFADRSYERGTLLIRRAENSKTEALAARLKEIGARRGVTFEPARSGYTDEGIDLGSGSVVPIMRPRIAVAGGKGVSSTSYGAVRFLLDQVVNLPHTVIPLEDVSRADLSQYTALVLPEASVPAAAKASLQEFAGAGGVVVALGRAAFSLASGEEEAISKIRIQKSPESKEPKVARPRFIEEREELSRREQQPGSVFWVELDPAHPVSFGYRREIAVFKSGTRTFDPLGPGAAIGVFKDAPALSGYVPDTAAKAIAKNAYLAVESRGKGAFVLFADDPNFRGTWRGMTRLFVNAMLLLPERQVPQPGR